MIWVTCWPSTSMGLASSSLSCCSLSSRLASLTLFEEIWEFATEMGAWVYPRSLSKIVLYANNVKEASLEDKEQQLKLLLAKPIDVDGQQVTQIISQYPADATRPIYD